jgi:hypothetical protein
MISNEFGGGGYLAKRTKLRDCTGHFTQVWHDLNENVREIRAHERESQHLPCP